MNDTAYDCAGGFNTEIHIQPGGSSEKLRHGATLEGDQSCAPNFHELVALQKDCGRAERQILVEVSW
jgi:hypothetical protein